MGDGGGEEEVYLSGEMETGGDGTGQKVARCLLFSSDPLVFQLLLGGGQLSSLRERHQTIAVVPVLF